MRKTLTNVCLPVLIVLSSIILYSQNMAQGNSPEPKRDINDVLAAHDSELLAIPDVIGVYVGTTEEGRTPCLKVMLARKNPESERKIPRMIDGYHIVTEVTGSVRAFGSVTAKARSSFACKENAPSILQWAEQKGASETNEFRF
jgi:hypothetical protein